MLKTITVLSTLVFLHNGDFQPQTTFSDYPCEKEPIFISGLYEADAYGITNQELYLPDDQQIFNFSTKTNEIKIYTSDNHTLVKTLYINWETNCEIVTDAPYIEKPNESTISYITTPPFITTTIPITSTTRVLKSSTTQNTTLKSKQNTSLTTNNTTKKENSIKLTETHDEEKSSNVNNNIYMVIGSMIIILISIGIAIWLS